MIIERCESHRSVHTISCGREIAVSGANARDEAKQLATLNGVRSLLIGKYVRYASGSDALMTRSAGPMTRTASAALTVYN